jgi:hypothetical protein
VKIRCVHPFLCLPSFPSVLPPSLYVQLITLYVAAASSASTVILHGSTTQMIDKAGRSLHIALSTLFQSPAPERGRWMQQLSHRHPQQQLADPIEPARRQGRVLTHTSFLSEAVSKLTMILPQLNLLIRTNNFWLSLLLRERVRTSH